MNFKIDLGKQKKIRRRKKKGREGYEREIKGKEENTDSRLGYKLIK